MGGMNSETQRTSRGTLSTDACFEVLSHRHRRILLTVLQSHDQPQAVADVVKEIAENEQVAPVDSLPPDDINRIHHLLYHVHIPKLVEFELITHDDDQNTIALTERATRLQPYIERIAEAGHVAW